MKKIMHFDANFATANLTIINGGSLVIWDVEGLETDEWAEINLNYSRRHTDFCAAVNNSDLNRILQLHLLS